MNTKVAVGLGALAIMAGTIATVGSLQSLQRLGEPGIRTTPIPGKVNVNILLPENLTGYQSRPLETPKIVSETLPPDSSMAARAYTNEAFATMMQVVLMGTDRTSIHRPQQCLPGQGFTITRTEEVLVAMSDPRSYELPVMKLYATKEISQNGRNLKIGAVYTYWFVAGDRYTASSGGWMNSMARTLLRTGTLERWAYVSCFSVCEPGREDAVFEQTKRFISLAAPQFQLVPRAPAERAEASPPR